jgi:hypothetical protein
MVKYQCITGCCKCVIDLPITCKTHAGIDDMLSLAGTSEGTDVYTL